jgi:hypothetical protein
MAGGSAQVRKETRCSELAACEETQGQSSCERVHMHVLNNMQCLCVQDCMEVLAVDKGICCGCTAYLVSATSRRQQMVVGRSNAS